MSRTLLLILPVMLLIGWCFWTKPEETDTTTTQTGDITADTGATTQTEPTIEEAKAATEQYLADAKAFSIDTTKKVKKDDNITVDYIGRLADGTVFDTSIESVAKAVGSYSPQKSYTEGLPFTVGKGQMIAGFDAGVLGMALNETKTITIPAKDAYGEDTVTVSIDKLSPKDDGSAYKVGDTLMTQNGATEILSINDKEFTMKNTHPLANKDLIFDITIKTIK